MKEHCLRSSPWRQGETWAKLLIPPPSIMPPSHFQNALATFYIPQIKMRYVYFKVMNRNLKCGIQFQLTVPHFVSAELLFVIHIALFNLRYVSGTRLKLQFKIKKAPWIRDVMMVSPFAKYKNIKYDKTTMHITLLHTFFVFSMEKMHTAA